MHLTGENNQSSRQQRPGSGEKSVSTRVPTSERTSQRLRELLADLPMARARGREAHEVRGWPRRRLVGGWGESGANPSLPVEQGTYREFSRIRGRRAFADRREGPVPGHPRRLPWAVEQGTIAR